MLVRYLRDINDHIRVIRRVDFTDPDRIRLTLHEHHEILNTVLNRGLPKACNLIRCHIHRSEEFPKTLTLTQLARKKW